MRDDSGRFRLSKIEEQSAAEEVEKTCLPIYGRLLSDNSRVHRTCPNRSWIRKNSDRSTFTPRPAEFWFIQLPFRCLFDDGDAEEVTRLEEVNRGSRR